MITRPKESKEEFIQNTINNAMQECQYDIIANFTKNDEPYIKAAEAKDKILSMMPSDASYNLQSLYKILQNEAKMSNVRMNEIPTVEELDDMINLHKNDGVYYKRELQNSIT